MFPIQTPGQSVTFPSQSISIVSGFSRSLATLYEVKELGYEIATLVSTGMGFNVYKRICFNTYCDFKIFGWSPNSNEVFSIILVKNRMKKRKK